MKYMVQYTNRTTNSIVWSKTLTGQNFDELNQLMADFIKRTLKEKGED